MRRLVSLVALAAFAAPLAAQAQIAEIDLPPSDVADPDGPFAVDDGAPDGETAEPDRNQSAPDDFPPYDPDAPRDDAADRGSDYGDPIADILDDPDRQEEIADAMSDMMRALMTIRVGPLVDAAREIDPDADIAATDPDATIGDIASAGDPDYEDRIEDGIRRGTAVSDALAREFARLLPGLIALASDLGAQAERAIDDAERR